MISSSRHEHYGRSIATSFNVGGDRTSSRAFLVGRGIQHSNGRMDEK
jgi:hypothetical protein